MGSPVIFSGSDVKALKSQLDLNGQCKILSGTVNPSSVATSAPIGSIYLNSSTGGLYQKTDAGSSTNWTLLVSGSGPLNSLYLGGSPATAGGYGSTNTRVVRFTTIMEQTGTGLTWTDSSSLGSFVTVNTAGIYAIRAEVGRSGDTFPVAITVNCSSLATDANNLTYAQGRRAFVYNHVSSYADGFGITLRLAVNDVLRVQTDGTGSVLTGTTTTNFNMIQVST